MFYLLATDLLDFVCDCDISKRCFPFVCAFVTWIQITYLLTYLHIRIDNCNNINISIQISPVWIAYAYACMSVRDEFSAVWQLQPKVVQHVSHEFIWTRETCYYIQLNVHYYVLFSSGVRVRVRIRVRIRCGVWLVSIVMHTYLCDFRLSLSHSLTCPVEQSTKLCWPRRCYWRPLCNGARTVFNVSRRTPKTKH